MRNKAKILSIVAGLTASCAVFVACNKDSNVPGTPSGALQPSVTCNMYMTDDPAAIYQQVNVEIIGAQVYAGSKGWITMNVHPGVYNLLSLSNGNKVEIGTATVPMSGITQARILLGARNTVVVNGKSYPLQLLMEGHNVITVDITDSKVIAGGGINLLIDFDAFKSVNVTAVGYVLAPSVRVVQPPLDGSIKGSVTPGANMMLVMATFGNHEAFTSVTVAGSGDFLVQALAPGVYSLSIVEWPSLEIKTVNNIQVASGQVSDVGNIELRPINPPNPNPAEISKE